MLSQLIYLSSRKGNCGNKEIDDILESSRKNNSNKNITGVLLYSDKKFLQVLEGEQREVKALYDVISRDSRHNNVMLISLAPIMKRTFSSWQMGAKDISNKKYELVSSLEEEEIIEFERLLNGGGSQENVIKLIEKLFK